MATSVVCPTVTAITQAEYKAQLLRIQGFATRIHVDFMDGIFVPVTSIPVDEAWWQHGAMIDLHLMHQKPLQLLETVVRLQPHLVIVHAEADNVDQFLMQLDGFGIKRGLALLQDTPVSAITHLLPHLNHVLIFSGNLGHFGGEANVELLSKVQELIALKPGLEIGWDGGITDLNVRELVKGGVDVLNVGGYIQKARDPEEAYNNLVTILKEGK